MTRSSVRTSARTEHIDWQFLSFRLPKQATKTNKATFVQSSPIFRQKSTKAFGNPFLFNLWQAFGSLRQSFVQTQNLLFGIVLTVFLPGFRLFHEKLFVGNPSFNTNSLPAWELKLPIFRGRRYPFSWDLAINHLGRKTKPKYSVITSGAGLYHHAMQKY